MPSPQFVGGFPESLLNFSVDGWHNTFSPPRQVSVNLSNGIQWNNMMPNCVTQTVASISVISFLYRKDYVSRSSVLNCRIYVPRKLHLVLRRRSRINSIPEG
jgi:hypothetical protein